jgi:hypothetical protein
MVDHLRARIPAVQGPTRYTMAESRHGAWLVHPGSPSRHDRWGDRIPIAAARESGSGTKRTWRGRGAMSVRGGGADFVRERASVRV